MRKTVVGCAVLLTIAGCGTPPPSGPTPAADATQLTGQAGDGVKAMRSVEITAAVTIQQKQTKMTGAALVDGSNTNLDLKSSAGSEVRVVDKAVYLQLPADARSKAGIGTPWLRLADNDPQSKTLSGGLDQIAQQQSPTAVLDLLAKGGKITKTWQTKLNNVPVTHYALTVDETRTGLADKLPADLAAKLPKTAEVDIWLDAKQLPVQVVMTMGDVLTSTVGYSNWGAKADVQAPAADQVTDAATLKH